MNVSKHDGMGALKHAFKDDAEALMVIDGFLIGAVGRKILVTYPTNSTEVYTYKEGSTTLYVVTVTYEDSTKQNLTSVERTA